MTGWPCFAFLPAVAHRRSGHQTSNEKAVKQTTQNGLKIQYTAEEDICNPDIINVVAETTEQKSVANCTSVKKNQ